MNYYDISGATQLFMLGLKKFLNQSEKSNTWIDTPVVSIYVRKPWAITCPKETTELQLANIMVHDEDDRGQGLFTSILTEIEKLNFTIKIELVHNRTFQMFFEKRKGYERIEDNETTGSCSFKRLKKE